MTARARPLPCPFCGSKRVGYRLREYTNGAIHTIGCDDCSTDGPSLIPNEDSDGTWTRADAARAWNTRAGKA